MAQANGYAGTEVEWLASLVGPSGPSAAVLDSDKVNIVRDPGWPDGGTVRVRRWGILFGLSASCRPPPTGTALSSPQSPTGSAHPSTPDKRHHDRHPDSRPTQAPAVPPAVRSAAYFALLTASALVLLAVGLAPIWLDDPIATRIVASGGVVTSVLAIIGGGLGVAYRPRTGKSASGRDYTDTGHDHAPTG